MDLKRPDVRAAFVDLVTTADVLIESFRPDVMARLGVGYDTLKGANPGLIYCSLNGFGCTGPLAAKAAHDINYLSLAGALYHVAGRETSSFDMPLADCAGGLFAALAILGALHGRARDGQGCHVDLALVDAVMPLQIFQLAELGLGASPSAPGTGLLNGGAACYHVYETADGRRVTLAALEAKFWQAFCAAAGRPEWTARRGEPLPQRALIADVAALFRALTLVECETRFGAADCCFAAVLDLAEAVDSPHVRSRGLVNRPPGAGLQPLFPAVVDDEPPSPRPPLREV